MAVDITRLVPDFRQADLQAYVDLYNLGDLQYRKFFPLMFTPSLTFESLKAQFSAKVAADVVAFDSRAPRKGRQLPGKITGEIPKIEVARTKKESDLNILGQLQDALARAVTGQEAIIQRIIDWMYDDSTFCVDGVNARTEWLAKRLASTGKVKLTAVNNEGGVVTQVDVDFGIPSGNKTNVATDWDTVATAKPIDDIKVIVNAARAKGFTLNYMIMDGLTFDRMAATTQVQTFTASFAQNAFNLVGTPNLDQVNTVLRGMRLPTIIIWDSVINLESKAGVMTSTTGWEDGKILFSATPQIGNTQWTTTADGRVTIDDAVKVQKDFVLVKAWAEQDPITVVTKGIAYSTPVLNGANSLYILSSQL